MKYPRIDPPYKAYALGADGTRRPLAAHGIIVELRPGIEVEINFAPHPNFAGHLTMVTPRRSRMKQLYDEGKIDDFAVVFGASNVLHVLVERRVRSPHTRKKRTRKAQKPGGRGNTPSRSQPGKTR